MKYVLVSYVLDTFQDFLIAEHIRFLKPFISKIEHIFCQLILEFW